ncbi:hypothetical protein D3C85_1040540 [compost metagenome]
MGGTVFKRSAEVEGLGIGLIVEGVAQIVVEAQHLVGMARLAGAVLVREGGPGLPFRGLLRIPAIPVGERQPLADIRQGFAQIAGALIEPGQQLMGIGHPVVADGDKAPGHQASSSIWVM